MNQSVERENAGNRRAPDNGAKTKKRKYTVSFTPEDHATIGRYEAENGNAAVMKRFKASQEIGESTVLFFKKALFRRNQETPGPKRRVPRLGKSTTKQAWTKDDVR